MAFFKIRKSSDPSGISSESTQTLDGIRLRAIFRLIGAAVLVAAAVIGFPLVFDSQPRPIAIDVSIDIPDKVKVSPLALPRSLPSATSPVVPKLAPIEEKVAEAEAKPSSAAAVTVEDTGPVAKGVALDESKSGPKPVSKPTAKPAAQSGDGAKVLALLEGKGADVAVVSRFVVQIGAFAEVARAKDARNKLESAGLKTYTQVIETKDGQRIRVRVGPFADKVEADRVVAKIKALGLSASVLSL